MKDTSPNCSEREALLGCWVELLWRQKEILTHYLGEVRPIETLTFLGWRYYAKSDPSASDIARELGMPRETVRRLLEELIDKGFLRRTSKKNKVLFELTPAGEMVLFGVFDSMIDKVIEVRGKHGLPTDYIDHLRRRTPTK